ncbi:CHASE3 domain-containing protein [Mucilaginibacter ginkgonis]|uniref:CHASE3 domain-containing protein n=1 Tax=Mucilaginibacter ginkgonis TaxID=2682091 RepID=A0A6I4HUS8_9SPHI|nr:CHASE3 domain-containing protein [Mucilaginibacter ginkgonis]QQL50143.1 CHASE3 domain-containing protein [Mucilaginibacter ginkgonis]
MFGNNLSFFQKLGIGLVVSVIIVFVITYISYTNLEKLNEEHRATNHSQEVIKDATDLLQTVTDAETAARGYFGTRQPVFVESFKNAVSHIDPLFSQLSENAGDDIETKRLISSLSIHLELKKTAMNSYVVQRQDAGANMSLSSDKVMRGKAEMDLIRNYITQITQKEKISLIRRQNESEDASSSSFNWLIVGSLMFLIVIGLLFYYIFKTFTQKLQIEKKVIQSKDELEDVLNLNRYHNWLLEGLKHLAEEMQGQTSKENLCAIVLKELLFYTAGISGTFYLFDKKNSLLTYCASHAVSAIDEIRKEIRMSETWLGQVAVSGNSKIIERKINANIAFSTSIVQRELPYVIIVPIFYEESLEGVIELGYWDKIDDSKIEFINSTTNRIGVSLHNMKSKTELESLLLEIQQQKEELQVQEEELREVNEQLRLQINTKI